MLHLLIAANEWVSARVSSPAAHAVLLLEICLPVRPRTTPTGEPLLALVHPNHPPTAPPLAQGRLPGLQHRRGLLTLQTRKTAGQKARSSLPRPRILLQTLAARVHSSEMGQTALRMTNQMTGVLDLGEAHSLQTVAPTDLVSRCWVSPSIRREDSPVTNNLPQSERIRSVDAKPGKTQVGTPASHFQPVDGNLTRRFTKSSHSQRWLVPFQPIRRS